VFVEDLPCTIFNIMYVVYGCFNAVAEGDDAEETVGNGKLAMLMSVTFFSVAMGMKKFVEWRGLKGDKRNVTSWTDSVKLKLAEARRLYNEVKGVETGNVVSRELHETAAANNVELRKKVAQFEAAK